MDIEKYLEPISDDNPCGDDLEYDADFREMELALEGKQERQMGDEVQPSEEPDWKMGKKLALRLIDKTRDIRVATMLTQSLVSTAGFEGLVSGLKLNQGLLENFWDCVYPQQDPEDDYPISRMNSLMALGESNGLARYVRNIPLVDVKGIGQYSLRDIDVAMGRRKPREDETDPATEAIISAAFSKLLQQPSEKEMLEAKAELVTECVKTLADLTKLLSDKVGAQNVPDFSALTNTLQNINKVYAQYMPTVVTTAEDNSSDIHQNSSAGAGGIIRNRDEALTAIDRVCDYFEHYEPSSPVPFILRRAKGLVNKDFIEILEDIVPESVNQAENITGGRKKE